jgi:hypothetical protein
LIVLAHRGLELALKATLHKRIVRLVALVLCCLALLVSLAPQVAAQGCAMCYQSAAGSGAQGREVLRHGVLILLVPSLSLFFGIFVLIYRRRNVARQSNEKQA